MAAPSKLTLTPEAIAGYESPSSITLSDDGTQVLYSLSSPKTEEHTKSALWIADVGVASSARQLTSGLYNDYAGVFTPDGGSVLFLSDRHEAGKSARIYVISLKGGEASPLFASDAKKGVSSFRVSPDGKHVTFTSADEPSAEDEKKTKEKDDAIVFNDPKDFARLRLFTFASGIVRTFEGITRSMHVTGTFTWSPDSTEILYRLQGGSSLEFSRFAVVLERIAIAPSTGIAQPERIGTYPFEPRARTLWTPSGKLWDLTEYEPRATIDSLAVHSRPLNDSALDFSKPASDVLYGEHETAEALISLNHEDFVVVGVASGVDSRVEVYDGMKKKFVLYDTEENALRDYDVKRLKDGSYILVAIVSSRARGEPLNVWSGVAQEGAKVKLDTRLSAHNKWLEGFDALSSEVWEWTAEDGTDVQGFAIKRKDTDASVPLPAVLVIHGGPYYRDGHSLTPSFGAWGEMLAEAGYLVLMPQYRGSSGRGSTFARAAAGGMGTLDWSDCLSMLDLALSKGYADPTRLGISGWSQGGFMTAWGVSQTKDKFKAAVMGAGVSDWGAMGAESDMPEFEAGLGGSAPWTPGERVDQKGSPIRYLENVETAVLILHGEKDARVPTTQAISFYRGLRRVGRHPERSQLVIYPRESHGFSEKKHAEDVLKRVLDHFTAWLK